jgi:predicted  nucleic acid-binding Zn-ribbon protein
MSEMQFPVKGKKKGPKFNNPYKIPNETANEIRSLDNPDLVARAALEYKNWVASMKTKKMDGHISDLKDQIKGLRDEIKHKPEVIEMEEKLKKFKDDLVSEEQAKLEEEVKNLSQPHNEDVKSFKGVFQVAMDEVARRKDSGAMK